MNMPIQNITLNDLHLRELELKAHGFDIMREEEVIKNRLSQLQSERTTLLKEIKKIYEIREQFIKSQNNVVVDNPQENDNLNVDLNTTNENNQDSISNKIKSRVKKSVHIIGDTNQN